MTDEIEALAQLITVPGIGPIISSAMVAAIGNGARKVRKKGKDLAQLDAQSRHKLRIQAKKLRYAVEFFASLFFNKRSSKRQTKFSPAIERLQDGLGDLNDIAVHEDLITAIGIRRRRSSRKRAFAAGLLTGREDARLDAALAAATEAYAKLAKLKPFWQ